jgi:hypothetical protein
MFLNARTQCVRRVVARRIFAQGLAQRVQLDQGGAAIAAFVEMRFELAAGCAVELTVEIQRHQGIGGFTVHTEPA